MPPVPPGRISSPAFPGPDASLSTVTEFITANPRAARAATVDEKARIIGLVKAETERLEQQEGGTLQKVLSPSQDLRERCVESQMALAILLESTLSDPVERDAILAVSPGLAQWTAARMTIFTNPRLRIIIERALAG
jgi:hypothetical protein